MPPRGQNTKKEGGKAKKAENEEKKKQSAAAAKEKKEEEKWNQGSKSNRAKEEKEEKRKAELARKQEAARILAEEEASLPSKPKSAPKASNKKGAGSKTPAGPGAIAAGGLSASDSKKSVENDVEQLQESFSATGIDDALDLMEVVNAKTDKASTGAAAAGLERHPERRFKAALEAYTERELPTLKEEHPGLRLNQYKELLYKQFQKSPDNPFNQTVIDFNASKEEKVAALKSRREGIESRLRSGD